jgi:cation:H+ antiporter
VLVRVAVPVFVAGALVSLSTSWLLVSRLERVGERLHLSEGLLGIVAALSADAPELTAAITASIHQQRHVGAGVVLGSNVFNLAALLGLGAVVAGRIGLHRKVVLLGGSVAMSIAGVCLAAVVGLMPVVVALVIASVAMALYIVLLGEGRRGLGRLPLARQWIGWLRTAIVEEELELAVAIRPRVGRLRDAVVAGVSLVVVVGASATMERAGSALGDHYGVPDIVLGGLVLAAVTSLPNAVAAIYLAARGRAAAAFSTALNSNAINVTAGLLVPAAIIGLGTPSAQTTLVGAWYVGLTACILSLAYRGRGLSRSAGGVIIAAYLAFVGVLLLTAQ